MLEETFVAPRNNLDIVIWFQDLTLNMSARQVQLNCIRALGKQKRSGINPTSCHKYTLYRYGMPIFKNVQVDDIISQLQDYLMHNIIMGILGMCNAAIHIQ